MCWLTTCSFQGTNWQGGRVWGHDEPCLFTISVERDTSEWSVQPCQQRKDEYEKSCRISSRFWTSNVPGEVQSQWRWPHWQTLCHTADDPRLCDRMIDDMLLYWNCSQAAWSTLSAEPCCRQWSVVSHLVFSSDKLKNRDIEETMRFRDVWICW